MKRTDLRSNKQAISKDSQSNQITKDRQFSATNKISGSLEEIQEEITSEGYGLRTPYGTHFSLDFVKYCEDIFSKKPMMRKSTGSFTELPPNPPNKFTSGRSHDSLESLASNYDAIRTNNDLVLMETKKRLEEAAYRSIRKKSNPNDVISDNRLLYNSVDGKQANNGIYVVRK